MKMLSAIAFLLSCQMLFAQNTREEVLFKKFLTISASYKKIPLQVEIEYKRTCDIPWYHEDSSVINGAFYVTKSGAYVRFGKGEQIITDTMTLMVMENINQMVLSHYKIDIPRQLSTFISMPNDSVLANMTGSYSIVEKLPGNNRAVLEITNKKNVFGTTLPLETNTLTYNTRTNEPISVVVTKRNLVKKNKDEKRATSAKIVNDPKTGDNYVKEDINTFVFKSIRHEVNQPLPVSLQDRIEKDIENAYRPVRAYKDYNLIVH